MALCIPPSDDNIPADFINVNTVINYFNPDINVL